MADDVTNLDEMESGKKAPVQEIKSEVKVKKEKVDPKQTLENNQDLKLFRCKNCSSEKEGQVWWSWNEATKQDPSQRRTLLLCPNCEQTLGIFDLDQEVDTKFKPKNLKQNLKIKE